MRENADQNISEYGHFSRIGTWSDTRKEAQNLSMTKIYSIGYLLNHDDKMLRKTWRKRSIQSVDIYAKWSNSLIGRKTFEAKTREPDC